METAYAQALMNIAEKGMSPHAAVESLRATLLRTGRSTLLPRIGRAFEKLWQRQHRKSAMTLTTARAEEARGAQTQIRSVMSGLNIPHDDLEVSTDDSLIGGWRLEGRETLVDASYKKHLIALYNRASQA